MARLTIDTGTAGNPATGDTLRTAMTKINANFQELYNNNAADGLLTTSVTNGDVRIQPNGTGNVEVDQLQISDTTITPITTNANLTLQGNGTGTVSLLDNTQVTGTLGVSGNVTFDGSLNRIGDFTFSGNNISATRSNDNLKLSASGTGAIEIDSSLVLGVSENDGSTTAIDLTKPVAILEGDSIATGSRTYTLSDGSFPGQIMYLIKGTDGGKTNSVANKASIQVTFSKSIGIGGELTVQNNLTRTIFSQYVHCITCIWRGDAWCISEQVT